MSDKNLFPPLFELPPDQLEAQKQRLMNEITRRDEQRWRGGSRRIAVLAAAQTVALIVALGVIVGLVVTGGSAGAAAARSPVGMSKIPDMTKIGTGASDPCGGIKGTGWRPDYCSWEGATGFLYQGWVQTAAIEKYGKPGAGLPLPIPLDFAQQYPGPVEVTVRIVTYTTQDAATKLLHTPEYTGSSSVDYASLPDDAINGGIAGEVDSLSNDGLSEYRFDWVGGTTVVEVNVLGANMTVAQAQAVAELAMPA